MKRPTDELNGHLGHTDGLCLHARKCLHNDIRLRDTRRLPVHADPVKNPLLLQRKKFQIRTNRAERTPLGGNLDRDTASTVAELFVELARERSVMLVVVTHNLDLARTLGTCLELRHGTLTRLPAE